MLNSDQEIKQTLHRIRTCNVPMGNKLREIKTVELLL